MDKYFKDLRVKIYVINYIIVYVPIDLDFQNVSYRHIHTYIIF